LNRKRQKQLKSLDPLTMMNQLKLKTRQLDLELRYNSYNVHFHFGIICSNLLQLCWHDWFLLWKWIDWSRSSCSGLWLGFCSWRLSSFRKVCYGAFEFFLLCYFFVRSVVLCFIRSCIAAWFMTDLSAIPKK
jgi:hypothetical protein